MGNAVISRRGGGGYATVKFENCSSALPKHEIAPDLSVGRARLAATAVGDYALFGGGYVSSNESVIVDAYSSSLTRSTPTVLSSERDELAATTVGGYALFGGGGDGDYGSSRVDAYSSTLTRSTAPALSEARSDLAATTVGDYALFGGGEGNIYSSTVDAYDFNANFMVYKNSKYKFQNMAEEVTVTSDKETISIPTPATGYVKFKNTIIS